MKRILASTAGLLIAAGGSVMAAPPATAAPLFTGGLVNVTVNDVELLNDVNVGVALNVAANVCDVSVNVLARQLKTGGATCDSATGPVEISQA
jgi:hypothetical protein